MEIRESGKFFLLLVFFWFVFVCFVGDFLRLVFKKGKYDFKGDCGFKYRVCIELCIRSFSKFVL